MDDSIGVRIAEARKRSGMNRNQLARALGTSWQHVDHWEKGRTRPTLGSIRKIAELLGASVDYLLGLRGSAEQGDGSTVDRFLRELAPADLSPEEEQWLRSAPIDPRAATPEAYLGLLERLRGVSPPPAKASATDARSGTRRRVDAGRLDEAIREHKSREVG